MRHPPGRVCEYRIHLEEADNLHGDEQRDGHHIGEEQPEGDAVDDPEGAAVLVVGLRSIL